MHFQNDLAAAEKALEQLQALAAPDDEAASAEKQLLSKTIAKYRQYFSSTATTKPAGNSPISTTKTETLLAAGNYPNPFNPETTIRFHLNERQRVRLLIFDLAGHCVRTLVEGELAAGEQGISWDGRDQYGKSVASGVYFYELMIGNKVERKRMTLVR